jgi:hypothetical protein
MDDTQEIVEEQRDLILRESVSVEIFYTIEKPVWHWRVLKSVSILSSI